VQEGATHVRHPAHRNRSRSHLPWRIDVVAISPDGRAMDGKQPGYFGRCRHAETQWLDAGRQGKRSYFAVKLLMKTI
jgi:hypothetical protein